MSRFVSWFRFVWLRFGLVLVLVLSSLTLWCRFSIFSLSLYVFVYLASFRILRTCASTDISFQTSPPLTR